MRPARIPVVGCTARGPLEVGDPCSRHITLDFSVPTLNCDSHQSILHEEEISLRFSKAVGAWLEGISVIVSVIKNSGVKYFIKSSNICWRLNCSNFWYFNISHHKAEAQNLIHPSNGTILCEVCWCCQNSLLGYLAQPWMGHHSNTGYQQAGSHSANLIRLGGLNQPRLVLIQQ